MNHLTSRQASAAGDLVQLYHKPVGPYEATMLADLVGIQAVFWAAGALLAFGGLLGLVLPARSHGRTTASR